jgi:hypothetical protein
MLDISGLIMCWRDGTVCSYHSGGPDCCGWLVNSMCSLNKGNAGPLAGFQLYRPYLQCFFSLNKYINTNRRERSHDITKSERLPNARTRRIVVVLARNSKRLPKKRLSYQFFSNRHRRPTQLMHNKNASLNKQSKQVCSCCRRYPPAV